jgi:hypothetical protein
MGDLNKTYLGYRPKNENLTKLAQYLSVKNAGKAQNNAKNSQFTNLASNKVLKNKRF